MAAGNESQGLKIAVASFVSLSVILAVTSYFLYSNYSAEQVKSAEAEQKAKDATKNSLEALRNAKDLREKVGGSEYAKYETPETLNAAMKKATEAWEQKLKGISAKLAEAIDANKGDKGKEVEKAREIAEQTLQSITNEPQATYNSRIDRMVDLVIAQGQLSVALLADNADQRQTLESVDVANNEKVNQAEAAAKEAREKQTAEHTTYEADRKSFLDKLASLTEQNGRQAAEVASLKADIERINQEHEKRVHELTAQVRELRSQLQKNTTVIERRQGVVTYVDYTRKEVRTTLNRGQGAREMMRFALFDRDAGLPSDKPKATIELVSVNNVDSIAKILNQTETINPIRVGDQVYSAAFGRKRFALVGKLDVNRDGKDDRAVVRRMIEMAGGVISYDLPPPNYGAEAGTLTAMSDWIVTDDEPPIFSRQRETRDLTKDDADFMKKRSDVISEARTLGVQPMPLSKLAGYLGYSPGMALPGVVEALDRNAARNILMPTGTRVPRPAPADKPKEGEPKDAGADEPK